MYPLETRLNVDEDFTNFVKNRLMEKSLVEGNEILVTMLGHFIPFKVISTDPKGVIKVVSTTELKILESAISPLQENIVAQGVLETTERQKDNLVEASSKSVEKLEPIEKEVVEQTETTYQLQGVLVLPDQSELPIGLKRIIGRTGYDLENLIVMEVGVGTFPWWFIASTLSINSDVVICLDRNRKVNETKKVIKEFLQTRL